MGRRKLELVEAMVAFIGRKKVELVEVIVTVPVCKGKKRSWRRG